MKSSKVEKYYKKQYRAGEKIYYLDRFSPYCSKIRRCKIIDIIKGSKEVIIKPCIISPIISMELIAPINKKGLLYLRQKRNMLIQSQIYNKEKEIFQLKSKLKRWKLK